MLEVVSSDAGVPAARLENVTLRRGGRAVLDALSLGIHGHGVTAVMGPNGAGKSLSLRLIAGLIQPDQGSVTYGEKIGTTRDIAVVFQKPVLLRRSVRANLNHALRVYGVPWHERKSRLNQLIDLGQLAAIADSPARALSGGEQQRVAMVRALAAEPRLLLLDEPTASLDPQATASIEALILRAASRGAAVVLVTHDRGQAERLATHIRFMNRGKLIESASASQFFLAQKSPEAQAYLAGHLVF